MEAERIFAMNYMAAMSSVKVGEERAAATAVGAVSSNENSPTKKNSQVLGREQAKKRLLAFAQQVNKQKEALLRDRVYKKWNDKYGPLKHTYIAEGEDETLKSFPISIIKFTKCEPSISYCENPNYAKAAYKTRKEVFDAADDETRSTMTIITNSKSPQSAVLKLNERSRSWFVETASTSSIMFDDSKTVVTTPVPAPEKVSEPAHCERRYERYSPHWETDSEEEERDRPSEPVNDLQLPPAPLKLAEIKMVSKVKINKIELPFFEDDEYLEKLIAQSGCAKPAAESDVARTNNNQQHFPEQSHLRQRKDSGEGWEEDEDTGWKDEIGDFNDRERYWRELATDSIQQEKDSSSSSVDKKPIGQEPQPRWSQVVEHGSAAKDHVRSWREIGQLGDGGGEPAESKIHNRADPTSRKRRSKSPIWSEDLRRESRNQRHNGYERCRSRTEQEDDQRSQRYDDRERSWPRLDGSRSHFERSKSPAQDGHDQRDRRSWNRTEETVNQEQRDRRSRDRTEEAMNQDQRHQKSWSRTEEAADQDHRHQRSWGRSEEAADYDQRDRRSWDRTEEAMDQDQHDQRSWSRTEEAADQDHRHQRSWSRTEEEMDQDQCEIPGIGDSCGGDHRRLDRGRRSRSRSLEEGRPALNGHPVESSRQCPEIPGIMEGDFSDFAPRDPRRDRSRIANLKEEDAPFKFESVIPCILDDIDKETGKVAVAVTSPAPLATNELWPTGARIDYAATEDSKRLSLDARLEIELGIKPDVEQENIPPIPSVNHHHEQFPARKRRGFGPKAAPMGALIFACPKALPLAPYIPPHLQASLYRSLVTTPVKAAPDSLGASATVGADDEEKSDLKEEKDWNTELKTLEAAVSNLEAADESVLEDLEEKLLLFEAVNMVPSRDDSPPPATAGKSKVEVKPAKVKPVELKPAPSKGILVMPRVSLLGDIGGPKKKNVVFADRVKPGDGTSSSDAEDVRSPIEVKPVKKLVKKVKKKRKKVVVDDYDPEYDILPPPPPPPGSPLAPANQTEELCPVLDKVDDAVVDKVVDAVVTDRVVDAVVTDRVVDSVVIDRVFDAVGINRVVDTAVVDNEDGVNGGEESPTPPPPGID